MIFQQTAHEMLQDGTQQIPFFCNFCYKYGIWKVWHQYVQHYVFWDL